MDFVGMKQRIFAISNLSEFNASALEIFHFQYSHNPIYQRFVNGLSVQPGSIMTPEAIPFLPIAFFKTHRIITGNKEEKLVFESSGTTGMVPSQHYVTDVELYEQSFSQGTERFYGELSGYCIFALLPSYLERQNSSLVYMVERLMQNSDRSFGGFFLYEMDKLRDAVLTARDAGKKIMFIWVTFALLEMAENYPMDIWF